MPIEILEILVLPLSIIIGFPLYVVYRNRMAKSDGCFDYSSRRIFKIIFLNFLINLIVTAFLSDIYFNGLARNIYFDALFYLGIALVFFGNGIYATSIILTSYVDKLNKKKDMHDKARDFLHGTVSHLIIYQSYLCLVGIISLTNSASMVEINTNVLMVIIAGIIMGIEFALFHIYNSTIRNQIGGIAYFGIIILVYQIYFNGGFGYWNVFYYVTMLITLTTSGIYLFIKR